MTHLFLSYTTKAAEDAALAEEVHERLTRRKARVWMDRGMSVGEVWRPAIDRALEQARGLLVVMSEASKRSTWMAYEAAIALAHGKPVVVLVREPMELRPWMERAERIDWEGETSWYALFEAIARLEELSEDVGRAEHVLPTIDTDEVRDSVLNLGERHDPAATAELIHALQHPLNVARVTAADVLESRDLDGDERTAAVRALRSNLKALHPGLRAAAARSIAAIEEPPRVAELLLPLLRDEVRSVREEAARSLGAIGERETVVPPLLELLESEGASGGSGAAVVEALGDLRASEALVPVRAHLERLVPDWAGDDDVARELCVGLKGMRDLGGTDAVPHFVEWLADTSLYRELVARTRLHVRASRPEEPGGCIAAHLVTLGARDALPELITLAASDHDAVRCYALVVLNALAEAGPCLESGLYEAGPFSRELAGRCLASAGEEGTQVLLAALRSEDPDARAAAAGNCRDERAVPALIAMLDEPARVDVGSFSSATYSQLGLRDALVRRDLTDEKLARIAAHALKSIDTDEARAAQEAWFEAQGPDESWIWSDD